MTGQVGLHDAIADRLFDRTDLAAGNAQHFADFPWSESHLRQNKDRAVLRAVQYRIYLPHIFWQIVVIRFQSSQQIPGGIHLVLLNEAVQGILPLLIRKIMDDSRGHSIKVLSPDVNESSAQFTVNKNGDVRFGLGSIKGFGSNVVDAIIANRKENGPFKDVWDFVERMGDVVNRKSLETLVKAGALDGFGYKRTQYYMIGKSGRVFLDDLYTYGDNYRKDTLDAATSLFGDMEEMIPERPEIPFFNGEEDQMMLLQDEKDLVGMFISSHPLDKYNFEIKTFTDTEIAALPAMITDAEDHQAEPFNLVIAGIVSAVTSQVGRTGKPYARIKVEDKSGSYEFPLFGKDYEAFLPYCKVHEMILVECEIRGRFFKKDEKGAAEKVPYVLNVKKMSLLGNLSADRLSGFQVELTTPMLSAAFREKLVKVLRRHKGDTPFTIFLFDPETRYRIQFYSKKFQVSVCSELISDLQKIGIDRYKAQLK